MDLDTGAFVHVGFTQESNQDLLRREKCSHPGIWTLKGAKACGADRRVFLRGCLEWPDRLRSSVGVSAGSMRVRRVGRVDQILFSLRILLEISHRNLFVAKKYLPFHLLIQVPSVGTDLSES